MAVQIRYKPLFICFGLLLGSLGLMAQPDTLEVDCAISVDEWAYQFEILVDETGRMGFEEARQAEGYLPLDSIYLPLTLGQRLWARTWVVNRCPKELDLLLRPYYSDSTVVYLIGKSGIRIEQAGNYVPGNANSLPMGWEFGVPIKLEPNEVKQLYILKWERTGKGPDFDPTVSEYWEAIANAYKQNTPFLATLSIFLGVLLITIIYNLTVAASLKSASYLFYGLYLISLFLLTYFVIVDNIVPALTSLDNNGREFMKGVGLNMAALFYLLFGRYFVNSDVLTPKWDRFLKILIGIRILLVVVNIIQGIGFPEQAMVGFALNGWVLVEVIFILFYLIKLIRLNITVLWFFIIGSVLVFFVGFGPVVVNIFFKSNGNDGPLLLTAFSLEILVFSLGLGYKVRQQQRDKLGAEQALNHELQKVNSAFGRFVPHAFIESLGHQSVLDVKLGDQIEKEVTVLFSDIRGYTTLAEGMTPQENFDFLNAYLGRMGPIIQAHNGFVNQYYGDGIMALFMNHPSDALAAAVGMQEELDRYNLVREEQGRVPLRIGIGMHTGPLMMGIIGDTLRLEAGVVSDTVNTAARMEGLTKHFGINVLLSEPTFQELNDEQKRSLRKLGKVLVKGRKQPTEVYQALGGEVATQKKSPAQPYVQFEDALQAYLAKDFAQAIRLWEKVAEILPHDHPTQYYLRLSREYLVEGVPDDWDGIERMMVK